MEKINQNGQNAVYKWVKTYSFLRGTPSSNFFKVHTLPQQKILDMPLLTILWYSFASVQRPLSYTITKFNWCIQDTGKSSWWSTAPCWSLETKQKGKYCQTNNNNQAKNKTSKQNHKQTKSHYVTMYHKPLIKSAPDLTSLVSLQI